MIRNIMDRDQFNNMICNGTVVKICDLQNGNMNFQVYWDTIQDRLIVDDNLNVREVPNDKENMEQIVRWNFNIPNEHWVTFELGATVMGIDVNICQDLCSQHDNLKTIGFMGDYLYGNFAITM